MSFMQIFFAMHEFKISFLERMSLGNIGINLNGFNNLYAMWIITAFIEVGSIMKDEPAWCN